MRVVKPYYAAALLLALFSCQSASRKSFSEAASADSTAVAITQAAPSSNMIMPLNSPARRMLRTASISARVEDLQAFTMQVEGLTGNLHGMVLQSTLRNVEQQSNTYAYHGDSLRMITVYQPEAHLELRVPAPMLDSVVHSIARWAPFTGHWELKQEDVTLTMLANRMKANVANKAATRQLVTTDKNALGAANYQDDKAQENIDRQVENLSLDDQVAYAALSVDLYQRQVAHTETIINAAAITRAGFGTALGGAARRGAMILRDVLLGIVTVWPFLLLLGAGVVVYRWWKPARTA
ncbi:DUF4349 domain-containing protein [Chitinophaga parva]|nr:DUF4349 domain-containing protein [Chitinophaga parva]